MASILIAEDDVSVAEFIQAGLSGAGHDVVRAADGGEVLTRLAETAPDLLLLDLHMPVMDGLEVLRRLRRAGVWPDVSVLFLTASDLTGDMVEARRLGARGYLVKPIRLPVLIQKVRRVLEEPGLLWLDDVTEARSR